MSYKPATDLEWLSDGPADAHWTLVLAHGAGQGMDSPVMRQISTMLGQASLRVVRFAWTITPSRFESTPPGCA